jgi:hypothetical protein
MDEYTDTNPELQSQIKQLQINNDELLKINKSLRSEIRTIQTENLQLKQQNHEMNSQVNAVLNSTIWRLLAPIRRSIDVFRQIRNEKSISHLGPIIILRKRILHFGSILRRRNKHDLTQSSPIREEMSYNTRKIYNELHRAGNQKDQNIKASK